MTSIKRPDCKYAARVAAEVLSAFSISSVPVDLNLITANLPDLKVSAYSWLTQKYGRRERDLRRSMGSRYGAIVRDEALGKNVIFLNDALKTAGDIRFTAAHELGHYFLGHLDDYEFYQPGIKRYLGRQDYNLLEREANCFARNLLSPAPVAARVAEIYAGEEEAGLAAAFSISRKAAETRLRFLREDLECVACYQAFFYGWNVAGRESNANAGDCGALSEKNPFFG